jgi:hypothetical protein
VPTRASTRPCSSSISTSGTFTTGSPNATGTPSPAGGAVEREVVGHPDRVGAEEPGDGRDRVGVDGAGLDAVVEGVEQVHRARAPEREQVAGDEWPVGQAGQRRVDGVPPAERTELRSGELHHPELARPGVEHGDGVVPGAGHVLVALERRVDVAPGGRRGHADDGEHHERGGGDAAQRPASHPCP